MKIKCHDCVYYDELGQDCIKDQYDGCELLADKCTVFKERKKCDNRYEDCSGMCSIICHKFPSDAGCKFIYKCKIDDYACDEKCDKHQLRHDIKEKNEELFILTVQLFFFSNFFFLFINFFLVLFLSLKKSII